MVRLLSMPKKVQVKPAGTTWILETLRGLAINGQMSVNNDALGGGCKKMIITDWLYGIVGGEILGERLAGGASEDDFDRYGVASFDKSRGGVGDGGKKRSCCKGEDLHVVWSRERWEV